MKITCCKGCEKREVGCHSKCPEYIAARETCNAIREKKLQEQELHQSVNDAQWNGYRRTNLNKIRKGRR